MTFSTLFLIMMRTFSLMSMYWGSLPMFMVIHS